MDGLPTTPSDSTVLAECPMSRQALLLPNALQRGRAIAKRRRRAHPSYMQVRTLLVSQRAPGGTTVVEGHSRNLRNLRIFNPLYCLRTNSIFALSRTRSPEHELIPAEVLDYYA
jgi:hypothetical protein